MAGLIKQALDKGVDFRRNDRAHRLVIDNGTVVGLEYKSAGLTHKVGAWRAVINPCKRRIRVEPGSSVKDHVAGPIEAPLSPPSCEGDGDVMAMEAQAAIANTKEAARMPAICIPGEEYDGQQLCRLTGSERANPGSIMVNRAGKRFVNGTQLHGQLSEHLRFCDSIPVSDVRSSSRSH